MISAHSLQRDTKKVIEAEQKRKGNQEETEIKRQQTTRLEEELSISTANNGRQVVVQFCPKTGGDMDRVVPVVSEIK